MIEEYKDIEGFPNYQVSNFGNVRNKKRNEWKMPGYDSHGYLKVDLYKDSKRSTRKIHRLVADAFIPKDESKLDINHIDGNKENNLVTNLERCTKSENMRHAFDTGLVSPTKITNRKPSYGMLGKKNPNGGGQKPIRVIETGKEYRSIVQCAREMDLSDRAIVECLKGRQRSHCGYHFEYI